MDVIETTAHLTLRLSGPLRLLHPDGRNVTPPSLKAQGILALLATSPALRRPRAWLQDKLWSDSAPEQGAANLRQTTLRLRREVAAEPGWLVSGPGWIGLDPGRVAVALDPAPGEWGLAGEGPEFCEGLDIADPEFEDWIRDLRLAHEDRLARDRAARAPPCPADHHARAAGKRRRPAGAAGRAGPGQRRHDGRPRRDPRHRDRHRRGAPRRRRGADRGRGRRRDPARRRAPPEGQRHPHGRPRRPAGATERPRMGHADLGQQLHRKRIRRGTRRTGSLRQLRREGGLRDHARARPRRRGPERLDSARELQGPDGGVFVSTARPCADPTRSSRCRGDTRCRR